MQSLRWIKKEKGVATILVVGVLLFFILFFFVVAIDFAYIYTVRGQLQNAADAAALAGGKLIDHSQGPANQDQAKAEAIKFAQENFAAGEAVALESEDVEFGIWDGTNFTPNGDPVNAIKVTTKLLASRGNAVTLYFGSLVGWPTMDIQRIAIAARPARANIPIVLCVNACEPPHGSGGIINTVTGTKFYWAGPYPEDLIDEDIQEIAWTAFSPRAQVSSTNVTPFFCGATFDSCDIDITTSNGVNNIVIRQLRCAFLNPLYDSDNKTCEDALGTPKGCTSSSDKVTSWKVLSPLTPAEKCPPADQGMGGPPPPLGEESGAQEPYDIVGYAEITVTDIGPADSSSSTSSSSSLNCACSALNAAGIPYTEQTEDLDKAIVIKGIRCVDCGDFEEQFGRRAVLVK